MTTFIDQAKEVLTTEQVTKLELLARKSADFETSNAEDAELMELKKEVKRLVANRDRQKNLGFLKDGDYQLDDILEVMGTSKKQLIKDSGFTLADIINSLGVSKKEVVAAVNKAFPKEAGSASFNGVLATYGSEDITLTNRITKSVGKLITEGAEKTFVSNLTDAGKVWMMENYVSETGPYKGQTIYPNINMIATKFKFAKATLRKELGLDVKKEEPKAPPASEEKKEVKAKKAA